MTMIPMISPGLDKSSIWRRWPQSFNLSDPLVDARGGRWLGSLLQWGGGRKVREIYQMRKEALKAPIEWQYEKIRERNIRRGRQPWLLLVSHGSKSETYVNNFNMYQKEMFPFMLISILIINHVENWRVNGRTDWREGNLDTLIPEFGRVNGWTDLREGNLDSLITGSLIGFDKLCSTLLSRLEEIKSQRNDFKVCKVAYIQTSLILSKLSSN